MLCYLLGCRTEVNLLGRDHGDTKKFRGLGQSASIEGDSIKTVNYFCDTLLDVAFKEDCRLRSDSGDTFRGLHQLNIKLNSVFT